MKPPTDALFTSDLWMRALESYAGAAHLTVKLFDADARVVFGPIHPTPLFHMFAERGYDPGTFAECARRCLAQSDSRPAVMVSQFCGLAVVGTSLLLEGDVVGAAVGGYAFVDFAQLSEVQVLAREAGIKFEQLWQVAREQKPVPQQRLMLNGELLQVLGDALLRENYRTRQLQDTAVKLEEVASAKEKAYRALGEQDDRLRKIERIAAAGQLASTMAHEINNPLAAVTNALYLLETRTDLDESARIFVTTAARELTRVSRIVKQSLSYYRDRTSPADLDLGHLVNESLQVFSGRFPQADIELETKIQNGTVLLGYPDEFRQMIDNLLLNALEAMPTGGALNVSVYESFDWTHNRNHRKGVRLTIADTGCGIPKDDRRRIFEPFFTTKPEKAAGLGLWVLQGIISKHDGVMSLRSSNTDGKSGTVVSIFLPSHIQGTGNRLQGTEDELQVTGNRLQGTGELKT